MTPFAPGPRGPSAAARAIVAAAILLAAAGTAAAAGPERYLILPFENASSERSLNWLGEALAISLADRFEHLGMRTAGRAERLEAMESLSIQPGSSLGLATSLRLAEAVRAGRLVTGVFGYDPNDGVVVSARLLDVKRARQVWEGRRPGTLAGIFGLMDPLVLEAAGRDEARVPAAAPSTLGAVGDPPLPLYEILVRGLQDADPDARIAALERGLAMNRTSPHLLRALAFELFDAGRPADALARLDAIPDGAVPDGWRLYLLRARILLSKGDAQGAAEALGRSVASGENADAHLLLARIHASRGETVRAAAEADLATGLDPGHPELPEVRSLLGSTPI